MTEQRPSLVEYPICLIVITELERRGNGPCVSECVQRRHSGRLFGDDRWKRFGMIEKKCGRTRAAESNQKTVLS